MPPMNERTIAARLATWVADLDFDQIPRVAVDSAKQLILDQVGLQINGSQLPNIRPELALVDDLNAIPQSTILGTGVRTNAAYAAFANGTLAGSSEFDDVHMFAAHIGSHVVPPAIAFAERDGSTGRDVITAVVAGAQVMSILGSVSVAKMVGRGWHGSKILGTFGAAATTAKLLGLDADHIEQALGIAGSDAGGGMEYEFSGGEVKRMHSGSAARLGAQAAILAQNGLTGPATIIEGKRGLFHLFADDSVNVADIESQWSRYHIIDTIFRMYPTIGSAATVLEGVNQIVQKKAFRWQDIKEIRVGLPAIAVGHGAATTHPSDAVSAQFSTAFGIALMLVHGSNTPADYMNSTLWTDDNISSVIDRVVPYGKDFAPDMSLLSAQIDIELNNGSILTHLQRGFRGHPDNPGLAEAVEEKFRGIVDGIIPSANIDRLVALVNQLEGESDMSELLALTLKPAFRPHDKHNGEDHGSPARP